MSICVVCNSQVDGKIVGEIFEALFNQVDVWGVDSLTENEQVVYEGKVCSQECFENMR